MIDFPFEFFEDEVREGFYVSGFMKRAWAAQMEVLMLIDSICKKHNISWYADFGTLLGAVRHKGYIPWDDDIDISMLRPDYERFLSIVEDELPEGFILKSMYKEEVTYELFIRIVNTGYYCNSSNVGNNFHDFCFPVGVDIFPFDYVSDNDEREEARYSVLSVISGAIHATEQNEDIDYEALITEVEQICEITIDRSCPIKQQLYICMDQIAKIFGPEESSYVTSIPYYIKNRNYKCDKESFQNVVGLPFENITINAPINYDDVLKCEYGDYNKIVKDGGDHNYPFYKKIEEAAGYNNRFYYKFKPEHLVNDKRTEYKTLNNLIKKYILTVKKVHSVLKGDLNINAFTSLMTSLQQKAIEVGMLLEERRGENLREVSLLEEYCEIVYQLYQDSAVAGSLNKELLVRAEDVIDSFEKVVLKNSNLNKDVVFLTYKGKYWNVYEKEYFEAKKDGCNVYVIPVPYYEVKNDGTFGELHYEKGGYPEYVQLVHYEEYDFVNRHPDKVFIQTPYDECNRVMSVPPFFYSSNIKQYTDELIYIPFFTMDEISNEKYEQTMEYFCDVPGLVHADKVIVQSDTMRYAYINRLTKRSGEEFKSIWESKIMSR